MANCSIGFMATDYLSSGFDADLAAISALISVAARITLRMPAAAPSTKNTIRKTGLV